MIQTPFLTIQNPFSIVLNPFSMVLKCCFSSWPIRRRFSTHSSPILDGFEVLFQLPTHSSPILDPPSLIWTHSRPFLIIRTNSLPFRTLRDEFFTANSDHLQQFGFGKVFFFFLKFFFCLTMISLDLFISYSTSLFFIYLFLFIYLFFSMINEFIYFIFKRKGLLWSTSTSIFSLSA